MTDTEALKILDRISSGENIYPFICANGNKTVNAAKIGAEAIRQRAALDDLLKCWEVNNDNTRT